jgi:hypothetical protein
LFGKFCFLWYNLVMNETFIETKEHDLGLYNRLLKLQQAPDQIGEVRIMNLDGHIHRLRLRCLRAEQENLPFGSILRNNYTAVESFIEVIDDERHSELLPEEQILHTNRVYFRDSGQFNSGGSLREAGLSLFEQDLEYQRALPIDKPFTIQERLSCVKVNLDEVADKLAEFEFKNQITPSELSSIYDNISILCSMYRLLGLNTKVDLLITKYREIESLRTENSIEEILYKIRNLCAIIENSYLAKLRDLESKLTQPQPSEKTPQLSQ